MTTKKIMTDESVAKKLGWILEEGNPWADTHDRLRGPRGEINVPEFTTSLDAIVAEIDARGLMWSVHNCLGSVKAQAIVHAVGQGKRLNYDGDTAPLALCSALLAYLKENK